MNSNEIIYLDLEKVTLYGWEHSKFDLTIDYLVEKVEEGHEFMPVLVRRVDKKTYELIRACPLETDTNLGLKEEGGHKRAVAHYIAGKKLKCKVVSCEEGLPLLDQFDIRNTILKDSTPIEVHGITYKNQLEFLRTSSRGGVYSV